MKKLKTLIKVFLLRNVYSIHWLHIISNGKIRPAILRYCGAKIGKHAALGPFVYWDPHLEMLEIGDDVIIGAQACFIFHDRNIKNFSYGKLYRDIPHDLKKTTIENNCRIGVRAMLLPGVTIGEGACVGAGALVTKDVPAWSVVAGSPAKIIRQYKKDEL